LTAAHDILPIFLCEATPAGPLQPVSFVGTGFRVADHILVTCWHCIPETQEGQLLAAVIEVEDGRYRSFELTDLAQDANASDLALARLSIDIPAQMNLQLASVATTSGADVWSYGYPLTTETLGPTGAPRFHLEARYLQGYVTRGFWHERPGYGAFPSYELDMPAPGGLSGAPVVRVQTLANRASRPQVVGVVYGRIETGVIEEFVSIDPDTGERRPEVQRVVSFAAAHYTSTLLEASGPATFDSRLADYIEAWERDL
jgi:hypothetical protein